LCGRERGSGLNDKNLRFLQLTVTTSATIGGIVHEVGPGKELLRSVLYVRDALPVGGILNRVPLDTEEPGRILSVEDFLG
jgi:hypothetical protein